MASILESVGEEKEVDNFAARQKEPAGNELSQQPKVDLNAMIKEMNPS